MLVHLETEIMRLECSHLSIKSCEKRPASRQPRSVLHALRNSDDRPGPQRSNNARRRCNATRLCFHFSAAKTSPHRGVFRHQCRPKKKKLFNAEQHVKNTKTNKPINFFFLFSFSPSAAGLEAQVQESSKDLYWF